jgi:hypothetical protein
MATSSLLGADRAPAQPAGRSIDALGPSDSTDSGSDVSAGSLPEGDTRGALPDIAGSDTDREGTGERSAVDMTSGEGGADIAPDQVTGANTRRQTLQKSEAEDLADEQGPSVDA